MRKLLLILLVFTIGITSCKKMKLEKQIDGIWCKTYTDDVDYCHQEYYKFNNDKIIFKSIWTFECDTSYYCPEHEFGYEGTFKIKKDYIIIELPNYSFISIKFDLIDNQLIMFHPIGENDYSIIYFKQDELPSCSYFGNHTINVNS